MREVDFQPAHWCEAIYTRRGAEFILYGRALGLSHNEAEDVLQDTFMAMLRKEEAPLQPEHYCVRAFRNRALNYRRSFWRRLTRELEARNWFEHSAVESEEERALTRALEELPGEQREAIVLKIWHRHTFEEIGSLLSLSPHTVAGRYRYGLQKLKRQLKGNFYERSTRCREGVAFLGPSAALGKP